MMNQEEKWLTRSGLVGAVGTVTVIVVYTRLRDNRRSVLARECLCVHTTFQCYVLRVQLFISFRNAKHRTEGSGAS